MKHQKWEIHCFNLSPPQHQCDWQKSDFAIKWNRPNQNDDCVGSSSSSGFHRHGRGSDWYQYKDNKVFFNFFFTNMRLHNVIKATGSSKAQEFTENVSGLSDCDNESRCRIHITGWCQDALNGSSLRCSPWGSGSPQLMKEVEVPAHSSRTWTVEQDVCVLVCSCGSQWRGEASAHILEGPQPGCAAMLAVQSSWWGLRAP